MVSRAASPIARAARRPVRAFTLLELLVALLLSSMVMLIAAASVRLAVRGVGDARVDMQRGTREDRVRALLAAQLAWLEINEEHAPSHFVGSKNGIDAQTMCCLAAPHRREGAGVHWRFVERKDKAGVFDLMYTEAVSARRDDGSPDIDPTERARAMSDSLDGFDTKNARTLLEGVRGVQMGYIGGSPGSKWVEEWAGPGLPHAVRISLVSAEGGRTTWIVPVAVTF